MRLVLIFFGVFLLYQAYGQEAVVVSNPFEMKNLAYTAQYADDTKGRFTIQDFLQSSTAASFQPVRKPLVNFGITPSVYWIKAALRNATGKELWLQISNGALTDLQIFEVADDRVVKQYQSGNWLPFAGRNIKDVEYVFPLAASAPATVTIYVRVQHYRGTNFRFYAGKPAAFHQYASLRDVKLGLYYGFMLAMLLYNLFVFFFLKDSSYLYYVLYVFLIALLDASLNGYAFRFLWPSWPALNRYEDLFSAAVGIAGILFAIRFLNTRRNVPLLHKILLVLLVAYVLSAGLILSGSFLLGSVVVEIISLLLVAAFFAAGYRTLRKGYKPAKFFLIAWSFLLVCVIIFIFKDFGLLPFNFFTTHALQMGSAIEALLLSIALADKINEYKKEKQAAQLEALHSLEENRKLITEQNALLEKRVQARTAELKEANNELLSVLQNLQKAQTQLIQQEKMASLGELTAGIAHEIQNPLNFVNNFSEANAELLPELKQEARRGNMDELLALAEDIEKNQHRITHHGKRADSIVKGMLQHARASSGTKESTDINRLTDEYLRLSYQGMRAKDKTFASIIETAFDAEVGCLHVVPQDIGRVLLNLFNNAFYAVQNKKKLLNDSYEPLVSVSTKKHPGSVEISVADNGTGISQKVKDKIFQPFFTTKPTGEGTGLGLSLSYDIITKGHGGELKVETNEGEGAAFIILLPLVNPKTDV